MNRRTFNPDQIRQLEASLHVASVSDRTIQYKGEFKIHAVRENLAGKRPIQIFEESGFDLDMIDKQTTNEALKRWRKIYRIYHLHIHISGKEEDLLITFITIYIA